MKKIAHFIDTDVLGGAEVLVIEICRHLGNYGFEPEVFHFGNPWLAKKCDMLGIRYTLVPGYKFYKSFKTIPVFVAIFSHFLKQRKIDILHSHLVDPITGSCIAAFLSGTSHIGTLHDTHTIEEKKSKIRLLQLAALFGTKLITVSKSMERFFQSMAKFPKGTFQTIYNGVNLNNFAGEDNKELRSELQLGSGDIVLTCVGRLVEIKRHKILIDAFSRVKSMRPIKLLIVGDGPEKEGIEALVVQKKMEGNIKLLGTRENVPELLNLSHCFVLASHSEGLSCSIMEAMGAGLPVVATDVGGNSELVRNGECGYLVPPNDPIAFADKLQILIDDDIKRRKFGEASLRIAQKNFMLHSMIDSYVRIYRNTL